MDVSDAEILVTGGAGFIGSNLIDSLLGKGANVICLDNFSTGKRENIVHLLRHQNFQLIEGDIRNAALCCKILDGVDYVFHEAALGSVPRSFMDPGKTIDVNVAGFTNVLDAARKNKIKRFIYASSSSVYGDSPVLPKTENVMGNPVSPYALSKLANELFAENYHQIYGLETVGLRYFNVYGRRQNPDGTYAAVIPQFASTLLRHRAPLIYGDGSNSRDFTYIDDIVQANLSALSVTDTNFVCNVAGGKQTALNELFMQLREELSYFDKSIAQIEPEYVAPRSGDIAHSLADISLARRKLNYNPKYSFAQGLHLTAQWYFENLA